jgi:hypothetical protein
MPIAAVIFGWPAVFASLVLAIAGIATERSRLVFAGAIVASPFLLYLLVTPRLRWIAMPVAVLLFLAPGAVARRQRRTAVVLLVPYLCVCAFVAYLVLNQRAD